MMKYKIFEKKYKVVPYINVCGASIPLTDVKECCYEDIKIKTDMSNEEIRELIKRKSTKVFDNYCYTGNHFEIDYNINNGSCVKYNDKVRIVKSVEVDVDNNCINILLDGLEECIEMSENDMEIYITKIKDIMKARKECLERENNEKKGVINRIRSIF